MRCWCVLRPLGRWNHISMSFRLFPIAASSTVSCALVVVVSTYHSKHMVIWSVGWYLERGAFKNSMRAPWGAHCCGACLYLLVRPQVTPVRDNQHDLHSSIHPFLNWMQPLSRCPIASVRCVVRAGLIYGTGLDYNADSFEYTTAVQDEIGTQTGETY